MRVRSKQNCTETITDLQKRENVRPRLKTKQNLHRENDRLLKKRQRQANNKHAPNCHSETEEPKDDMEDVINRSKKAAMKFLHRTKDEKNPHKHREIVCIICDRCIIGNRGNPQANKGTDFIA